jgi:DNA-binding transcriptional LysR family regulator
MQSKRAQEVSCLSMMDMRRLAVFHEVAERGSFSAASLALNFTQSVVSHHVAQLERELGLSLFERGKRPVRLTPAGERLHSHSGAILGATRAAEQDMRALAGLETGTLRVGAHLTACTTFVPPALGAFSGEHPDIEVALDQLEPPAAIPRLISGELDLAVAYVDIEEPEPRLERAHLIDDEYRIVVPPGHRLARRREVSIKDLEGERLNAPRAEGSGLQYRRVLEQLCADHGFSPDIVHVVTDVSVARAFIAAGLSVGLMPELSIPHPRPDVVVKPVRDVQPFRSVYALWMKGRRTPAVAPMVAALRAAAGRLS